MSDTVISVEHLSKSYLVGQESAGHQRYASLRDAIGREIKNFGRNLSRALRGQQFMQGDVIHEFWALQDVSFEVKRGETLGIIGRNGAGKSTLLKILSRITEPTAGRVMLKGRVASLLEVGTGFHPELTGRENLYLNGAILGMTQADIRRRFDEIVQFAGVEEFIDTPVKRYSSGMYVRLAFAVAAHLEPEILIVDEVLAVGDVEFQKRCVGKMGQSAKEGRTVLFVSHDMHRAASLCQRGIVLNRGRIECDAEISSAIETYMAEYLDSTSADVDLSVRTDRTGSGDAQFQSIRLSSGSQSGQTFVIGQPFTQTIGISVKRRIGTAIIGVTISTSDGIPVHHFVNSDDECNWDAEVGEYVFSISIDRLMLYPGSYFIDLWLGDRNHTRVDHLPAAVNFTVIHDHTSGITRHLNRVHALVLERSHWSYQKERAVPGAGSVHAAPEKAL